MFRIYQPVTFAIFFTTHIAFASTMDFPIWPANKMLRERGW